MTLVLPTKEYEQAALDYIKEHIDSGETYIHGSSSLHRYTDYEVWLEKIRWNLTEATSDWVTGEVYFALVNDRIVGTIAIRHFLNEALSVDGGHIGYGVRPTERRKGYAKQMLSLALERCKELEMDKVLITCDKDNYASAATAMSCGGILEQEVVNSEGERVLHYWIVL